MTDPVATRSENARAREPRDASAFEALTSYLDGLGTIAFLVALDGSHAWISASWARDFGGDRDAIARDPRSLVAQVHPDDVEHAQDLVHRVELLADGTDGGPSPQLQAEVRVFDAHGTLRWLDVSCTVVTTGSGDRFVVGMAHDTTPLHEANDDLVALTVADAEASRATAEFVSKMSHELRTPLHAILGYAQLLEMGAGDPADYLSRLRRAGDHVVQLLDDLLDYSRMTAARLAVSDDNLELRPVLDGAIDIVSALARTFGITVERRGDDSVHVRADATRLRQVFVNVLSNAIKYNEPGGSVMVTTSRVDGRVVIDVTDTGPGIVSHLLARVFVPFDRLGAESTNVAGAGLGLPLSLGLMRAMGGDIAIESTEGVGTTFRLQVDTGEAAHAAPERDVVCIDDDPESRRILEAVLSRLPGARVHTAGSATRGLRLLAERTPALIVLDRHLPGQDADKLLRVVARVAPGCPVVMVSSDPAILAADFLRPPLVAAFAKPLDLEAFLAAVARRWSMQPA